MKSGCLNMVLTVATTAAAVVITTIGATLFLFSASSFGPSGDFRTIIPVIVAPIVIYLFYRVGRDVWRDLKNLVQPGTKKDGDKDKSSGG